RAAGLPEGDRRAGAARSRPGEKEAGRAEPGQAGPGQLRHAELPRRPVRPERRRPRTGPVAAGADLADAPALALRRGAGADRARRVLRRRRAVRAALPPELAHQPAVESFTS